MTNNPIKKIKLSDPSSSIKSYIQFSKQMKKISCKPLNKSKFNNQTSFDSNNITNKMNLKTEINDFSNLPPITSSHNNSSEKPFKTININNSYKKKSTLTKNLNKTLYKPILMNTSFANNNNYYNGIIHHKNKTKIINHKKINSMKVNNTKSNELNSKIKEYYTLLKKNKEKKINNNSTSFKNKNIICNNNKIKKILNNSMNNRHKAIKSKGINKAKLNDSNIKEKKRESYDDNFNKIVELLPNNSEYNNRNSKINSIKIEALQTFSKEEINNNNNDNDIDNNNNSNNICKTVNNSNAVKPTIKVNLNDSIKNELNIKINNNKFNNNKICTIPMTTKNNYNNKYNKLNYINADFCKNTHKNKFYNKLTFKKKIKNNMNKSFVINKKKIYNNEICFKDNKNRIKCSNSTVYRKKKNEGFEIQQKNSEIFEVISNIQVKSYNEYEQEHKIKEDEKIIKNGDNSDIDNKNNININININYNNININKDNHNNENIEDKEEYDFYLKETFSKDRFSFKPSDESQDLVSNYQKLSNSNKLLLEKQDFDKTFLCNADLTTQSNEKKTKKIAVFHTRINTNKIKKK